MIYMNITDDDGNPKRVEYNKDSPYYELIIPIGPIQIPKEGCHKHILSLAAVKNVVGEKIEQLESELRGRPAIPSDLDKLGRFLFRGKTFYVDMEYAKVMMSTHLGEHKTEEGDIIIDCCIENLMNKGEDYHGLKISKTPQ
jgi:hypothetical protein